MLWKGEFSIGPTIIGRYWIVLWLKPWPGSKPRSRKMAHCKYNCIFWEGRSASYMDMFVLIQNKQKPHPRLTSFLCPICSPTHCSTAGFPLPVGSLCQARVKGLLWRKTHPCKCATHSRFQGAEKSTDCSCDWGFGASFPICGML